MHGIMKFVGIVLLASLAIAALIGVRHMLKEKQKQNRGTYATEMHTMPETRLSTRLC